MAASSDNNTLEFPFNSDREYELRLGNSFHSKGGPKTAFHTMRCKIGFPYYIFIVHSGHVVLRDFHTAVFLVTLTVQLQRRKRIVASYKSRKRCYKCTETVSQLITTLCNSVTDSSWIVVPIMYSGWLSSAVNLRVAINLNLPLQKKLTAPSDGSLSKIKQEFLSL